MSFSEIGLICTFPFGADDPVLVDVGAHHGSSSLWFAQQGWRVLAFEPEPDNRASFESNMRDYSNVTCLPLAVSDTAADLVPFFVSEKHFGIHSLKPFHETHSQTMSVRTVRLDDALGQHDISKVTFLKIDIEGADFLALKGFDVERFKPEVIMLEFMDSRTIPGFDYDHHDVVQFMTEQGYATFVSEWLPVKEYAQEGQEGEAHQWLGCNSYPLDHEPSWGNLIFVPQNRKTEFEQTLHNYLVSLGQASNDWFRPALRKIPGLRTAYRYFMRK